MRTHLPNFSSLKALILLTRDANRDNLQAQLKRLNLEVDVQWPPIPSTEHLHHVVFFDVDRGYDGMFNWPAGEPPVPLIAIVGSEAPGRLEWALSQKPSSHLLKPIGSSGVFHALFVAFSNFAESARARVEIEELNERIRCRPIVVRTILKLMEVHEIGDDEAFRFLRDLSMKQQMSIEEMSHEILSKSELNISNTQNSLPPRLRNGPETSTRMK
ncbi:ANTAR domain-containing response regulator [Martelella soudanensis]|uniref:ANTAR domain-containing response regulator n=1 Tax=unclassified Martelella TaxID=2629616 RepID=UPI0015E043AA|nr:MULTISPECIES: ANTAR domain-containing protein [unclassified Martelella]